MKNILILLGAVGIGSSATINVVACGQNNSSQPKYVIAEPNLFQIAKVGQTLETDVYVGGYVDNILLEANSADESILKVVVTDNDPLSFKKDDEEIKIPIKKIRLKITGIKIGTATIKLAYGSAKPKNLLVEVI